MLDILIGEKNISTKLARQDSPAHPAVQPHWKASDSQYLGFIPSGLETVASKIAVKTRIKTGPDTGPNE